MGLGRRPGPAGCVMLGSLPRVSSVVPACGSCLQRRQEVEESRSRGVGCSNPTATSSFRPQAGRWPASPCLLDSPALRLQNSTNDPGMSMKTKEEVKKSRSRGVEESRSDSSATKFGEKVHRRPVGQLPDSRLSTLDSQLSRGTKRECL